MDLTEAEDIKKRWQKYTEELYKKDLHDKDNHDGVISGIWTHLWGPIIHPTTAPNEQGPCLSYSMVQVQNLTQTLAHGR